MVREVKITSICRKTYNIGILMNYAESCEHCSFIFMTMMQSINRVSTVGAGYYFRGIPCLI